MESIVQIYFEWKTICCTEKSLYFKISVVLIYNLFHIRRCVRMSVCTQFWNMRILELGSLFFQVNLHFVYYRLPTCILAFLSLFFNLLWLFLYIVLNLIPISIYILFWDPLLYLYLWIYVVYSDYSVVMENNVNY